MSDETRRTPRATPPKTGRSKPSRSRSGPPTTGRAARSLQFAVGDQVRLTQDFAGNPAGSEGRVVVVDPQTSSLTVNILRDPQCQPASDVLQGAPMSIFDKNCRCDLGGP